MLGDVRDLLRKLFCLRALQPFSALVAIGQATGEISSQFCSKLELDYPCLGDPDRISYSGFDFPRGSWGDVIWKPFLSDPAKGLQRVFKADAAGARLRTSDVRQLGGIAIVSPEGRIRFRYRQRTSGDLPEIHEILAALDVLG